MNKKNIDKIVGGIFLLLTLVFILVSMSNAAFFDWVFERHHNQWSWYLRPIFLVPFCFFAYKRSFTGMMISIFALFTSMFWFPKPEVVSQEVMDFLQFEKDYLYGEWNFSKILLTLTIPVSFILLGVAFWKRSLFMGIAVMALMATGKVIWSVQNAGEAGKSIIVPAALGLLVCSVLVYFGYRRMKK